MAPPFYVTTPIYYVNDVPHIGHAYTTVAADALARWHRLLGDDVLFLTGTDEHGLKVAETAQANGVSPQEWTDRVSERFRETWRLLDISNDDFIRTTEPRHYAAVQRFLTAVYENGDIELGTYEGLYCVSCEDYYTEAQLVDGQCPIHGRPVELMMEENYFFKLSRYTDRLLEWYEANPDAVQPATKRNEALGFIKSGLQDISITRTSFDWGVPVPWDDRHVFYVWYDALINYATAAGYGADEAEFATWWPGVHHIIGKEILRFHCVWWPAMCMAAGIEPPAHVFVHGWLLVGGEKMSKTRLNQIAPAELVEEFGVDAYRYHFLRDAAFGPDGDFSYEGMVGRYNADLANNLGNLLSRVATVVDKKCGGVGPAPEPGQPARGRWPPRPTRPPPTPGTASPRTRRSKRRGGSSATPTPTSSRTSPGRPSPARRSTPCSATPSRCCASSPILATPAMPRTGEEIWRRIGLDGRPSDLRLPDAAAWGGYPAGRRVEKGPPLFPRMSATA